MKWFEARRARSRLEVRRVLLQQRIVHTEKQLDDMRLELAQINHSLLPQGSTPRPASTVMHGPKLF